MSTETATQTVTEGAVPAWLAWRAEREEALARPHDWLSVSGFHWISAEPARLGDVPGVWVEVEGRAQVSAEAGEGLRLLGPDGAEAGVLDGVEQVELLEAGARRLAVFGEDVLVEVVRRGGYYAVRLRDPAAPARSEFAGVPAFDYDPAWVLNARLEPFPQAREVPVGAAAPGLTQLARVVGEVVVVIDGAEHRLLATAHGPSWSVAFTDETSGRESSAWRAVGVEGNPHTGRGVLDFNRAVNYPYAFSDFGTCPRPVEGNHLPVAVRAGEKAPAGRTGVPPIEGGPTALPGKQLLP